MAVKPGGAIDPESRLDRVLSAQEAGFVRAFMEAVRSMVDAFTLAEFERLVVNGSVDEALETLFAASARLADQYGDAFTAAGRDTARFLSQEALTVAVGFDQVNERAVAKMRTEQLRLIREFSDEQRRATRVALTSGITDGLNPRAQAINLRQSLGLTQRQYEAVRNYRRLLESGSREALSRELRDRRFDRTVLRAIDNDEVLSQAQITRMTERYQERYIRYRSQVIARTEALRAVHAGTEEMYEQAIDLGQINAGQIARTWNTAGDERVRESHRRLNGQVKGMGEAWQATDGELRFPGDPNAPASETIQCRCIISTRIMAN